MDKTTTAKTVAAPSLNVYKKVAIVRKPGDTVSFEDDEGNIKSLSIQDLGDAVVTAVSGIAFTFTLLALLVFMFSPPVPYLDSSYPKEAKEGDSCPSN